MNLQEQYIDKLKKGLTTPELSLMLLREYKFLKKIMEEKKSEVHEYIFDPLLVQEFSFLKKLIEEKEDGLEKIGYDFKHEKDIVSA